MCASTCYQLIYWVNFFNLCTIETCLCSQLWDWVKKVVAYQLGGGGGGKVGFILFQNACTDLCFRFIRKTNLTDSILENNSNNNKKQNTHTCTHTCLHAYELTHARTCMHTHIHTHTQTHTHTHKVKKNSNLFSNDSAKQSANFQHRRLWLGNRQTVMVEWQWKDKRNRLVLHRQFFCHVH